LILAGFDFSMVFLGCYTFHHVFFHVAYSCFDAAYEVGIVTPPRVAQGHHGLQLRKVKI
jgi:hypothetical protein